MPEPIKIQLNKRAAQVLEALVGRHIRDGRPVGSGTLARETALGLSAATLRNVMADLEAHGLIRAPHTSAGRIPTQRGYRWFIDHLLGAAAAAPLDPHALGEIEDRLVGTADPRSLLSGATEILSHMTSFAGVVSVPRNHHVLIRCMEFLPLPPQRVLAILITEDGQVHNRVLSVQREYEAAELAAAAEHFNAEYASRPLDSVRRELLARMRRDRRRMRREMHTAISMARCLLDEEARADDGGVLVSGENNLLTIPGLGGLEKLCRLLDAFKTKQVLFELLQKSMFADGVRIFVGEECGYRMLRDCSIIAAPYEVDHHRVGVLGVIGPTRMNYDEVIPVVDATARLLGSALSTPPTP